MASRSTLVSPHAVPVRRLLVVAALGLLGGATSCGGLGECQPGKPCEVRGYAVVGFEVWAFQRCDSEVLISVNVKGNEPGIELLNDALHEAMGCTEVAAGTLSCARQDAAVYVEMTAAISAPGHYGHLGKYERELEMLQVHQASPAGPSDCRKRDPAVP